MIDNHLKRIGGGKVLARTYLGGVEVYPYGHLRTDDKVFASTPSGSGPPKTTRFAAWVSASCCSRW